MKLFTRKLLILTTSFISIVAVSSHASAKSKTFASADNKVAANVTYIIPTVSNVPNVATEVTLFSEPAGCASAKVAHATFKYKTFSKTLKGTKSGCGASKTFKPANVSFSSIKVCNGSATKCKTYTSKDF